MSVCVCLRVNITFTVVVRCDLLFSHEPQTLLPYWRLNTTLEINIAHLYFFYSKKKKMNILRKCVFVRISSLIKHLTNFFAQSNYLMRDIAEEPLAS